MPLLANTKDDLAQGRPAKVRRNPRFRIVIEWDKPSRWFETTSPHFYKNHHHTDLATKLAGAAREPAPPLLDALSPRLTIFH